MVRLAHAKLSGFLLGLPRGLFGTASSPSCPGPCFHALLLAACSGTATGATESAGTDPDGGSLSMSMA